MKKKKIICENCGRIIDGEHQEYEGKTYCIECFEEEFYYCPDCEEYYPRDNFYYVESTENYVCDNCINNYERCEDCGEYYTEEDTYEIQNPSGGYNYRVCDHCTNNGDYCTCDDCGYMYHIDDLHYHESDDRYYCDDCYDNHRSELAGYHDYDSDWKLFHLPGETPKYYIGKEIELEPLGSNNVEEVLNIKDKYLNAFATEDGSLNYGGVEVVTHPESFNYIVEHKENYRNFFNEIKAIDYGNDGHCGLHFHVTRPNDEVISRLIVIMESFKDEIIKLSRRTENQIDHWAQFLSNYYSSNSYEKLKFQSTKYLKDKYLKSSHDRYCALNLTNSKTIEFRFFNGANNFEEFWASFQFINNLVEIAYDETRELNTIKWKDLIVGEELENQARKLDVYEIDKTVKETTEIIAKLEDVKRLTKVHIIKTLDNMIKYINKQMSEKTFENLKSNDIDQILRKTNLEIEKIESDLHYLSNVIYLRNSIDDNSSIEGIKYSVDRYKNDKYQRYFRELNKIFKNYESEVAI